MNIPWNSHVSQEPENNMNQNSIYWPPLIIAMKGYRHPDFKYQIGVLFVFELYKIQNMQCTLPAIVTIMLHNKAIPKFSGLKKIILIIN